MDQHRLPLRGSPGSPYTRKMLALLRYRHIAYRFLQEDSGEFPSPKVALIPIVYFRDEAGDWEATVDSTPIIRRLEDEYPGRAVIPDDPAMAFINGLLEDYGDEWLTKAMFHYRWYYEADIERASSVLPHYADVSQSDDVIAERKRLFAERQIGRIYVVGSNDTTASVIEDSYRRFLSAFNDHLKDHPFLLGARPSSADFACFGQLTQLAQFDPTPEVLTAQHFPRVHAWVSKVEDLSGLEPQDDDYFAGDAIPQSLRAVLTEIGRTYAPVVLANAQALDSGAEQVATEVDSRPWVQQPFPYQGKCLQWLRIEYARLDDSARSQVDAVLAGTGCEVLFQPA